MSDLEKKVAAGSEETVNEALSEEEKLLEGRKKWDPIEKVGLVVLIIFFGAICVFPKQTGGIFDAMLHKCVDIIIPNFIIGDVLMGVLVGFITCALLERLGMTDALMRVFLPLARKLGYNPTVIVSAVYNIIGDALAASRIAPPVMRRAGATKHDWLIAIATNMQPSGSFAVVVMCIIALGTAGINALLVVVCAIFIPIIITPWILSHTIWRDIHKVDKNERLPKFTPDTPFIDHIFSGARNGASVGFLIVIPTVAVIMCVIGLLEYVNVWHFVESGLGAMFSFIHCEPQLGVFGLTISPIYASALLVEQVPNLSPVVIFGTASFLLSTLPLVTIVAQLPAIWIDAGAPLKFREAMGACILGFCIKLVWVLIFSSIFGLFVH